MRDFRCIISLNPQSIFVRWLLLIICSSTELYLLTINIAFIIIILILPLFGKCQSSLLDCMQLESVGSAMHCSQSWPRCQDVSPLILQKLWEFGFVVAHLIDKEIVQEIG